MKKTKNAKAMLRPYYNKLRDYSPHIYFSLQYYKALKRSGAQKHERDQLFATLIKESADKKCLQIGVKEGYGDKFGSNWVSVDKYDSRDFIDYNYDIHDLKFPDNEFDAAVCMSILEHVPYPEVAIREMHRVLKPGGWIWVQLPFNWPYHEAPKDYWRAAPDGLRIWMKDFEEERCGYFAPRTTAITTSTYYFGRKRA